MAAERNFRVIVIVMVFFLWLGAVGDGPWGQTSPPKPSPVPVPFYTVPARAELCGESIPLAKQDVYERFDREFTLVVYNHAQVYLWLKRAERYFPWLEKQLTANGLPDDLKYVAVAESDLMTSACSPAGAVGPWQFIADTGSRYGLSQTERLDERNDFEEATVSALRYLKDLHGQFNNWALAMAAYNCGEKRVEDSLAKQKVSSYYDLKLPLETERYVLRIAAIKEVLSHPERYGYTLPKGAGYPVVLFESVSVSLPYPVPVQAAAEAAGITYRELRNLNPSITSDTLPAGSYKLKVPQGRGKTFEGRLNAVKESFKPSVVSHKVKKGETLSGIASRYDVSEQDIKSWNRIKGGKLRIGQVLRISR